MVVFFVDLQRYRHFGVLENYEVDNRKGEGDIIHLHK